MTCNGSHLAANLGSATNWGGVVGITVACFFVTSTQPFLIGEGATPVFTYTSKL